MSDFVLFENRDLLPAAWRPLGEGALRAFNPGILREGDGWILAYRVVGETDTRRRIAICRLDREFRIVPDSASPLTDHIRFRPKQDYSAEAFTWFADPRLYRLAGRLFIYWNSGWHEPQNHQFLQELDARSLQPIGHPREYKIEGDRRKLEKNWCLFGEGPFHAVYCVAPHRVLSFSLAGEGPIVFRDEALIENPGAARAHGGLRGGAPPQRRGDHYYSFCHTIHDAPGGYRYAASAYRFAVQAPFGPTDLPHSAVPLPNPLGATRAHPKLNGAVSEVIYPAGAAAQGDDWVISYGINDERCAIAVLGDAQVLATLQPAASFVS